MGIKNRIKAWYGRNEDDIEMMGWVLIATSVGAVAMVAATRFGMPKVTAMGLGKAGELIVELSNGVAVFVTQEALVSAARESVAMTTQLVK